MIQVEGSATPRTRFMYTQPVVAQINETKQAQLYNFAKRGRSKLGVFFNRKS